MGPYAIQLSEQLVDNYQRLIQVKVEEDGAESALAAVGCVTALRRILESASKNKDLLPKIESIIYPVLMHSLTSDGIESLEDGLDCIALIVYHGGSQFGISKQMWELFPQLLYVIGGDHTDHQESGFGYEFLPQITVCLQNYISKDSKRFLESID